MNQPTIVPSGRRACTHAAKRRRSEPLIVCLRAPLWRARAREKR